MSFLETFTENPLCCRLLMVFSLCLANCSTLPIDHFSIVLNTHRSPNLTSWLRSQQRGMLENEGARRRGKSRKLDNRKHGFHPRSAKQGTMLGPGFVKKSQSVQLWVDLRPCVKIVRSRPPPEFGVVTYSREVTVSWLLQLTDKVLNALVKALMMRS